MLVCYTASTKRSFEIYLVFGSVRLHFCRKKTETFIRLTHLEREKIPTLRIKNANKNGTSEKMWHDCFRSFTTVSCEMAKWQFHLLNSEHRLCRSVSVVPIIVNRWHHWLYFRIYWSRLRSEYPIACQFYSRKNLNKTLELCNNSHDIKWKKAKRTGLSLFYALRTKIKAFLAPHIQIMFHDFKWKSDFYSKPTSKSEGSKITQSGPVYHRIEAKKTHSALKIYIQPGKKVSYSSVHFVQF